MLHAACSCRLLYSSFRRDPTTLPGITRITHISPLHQMANIRSRPALSNPPNHTRSRVLMVPCQLLTEQCLMKTRNSVDFFDFRHASHDFHISALLRCLSLSLFSYWAHQVLAPVYISGNATSALHAQHWWFSGKIGRCHEESSTPLISASPGFDSRPMHPFKLTHVSQFFCFADET
jgi:hypothetical protein